MKLLAHYSDQEYVWGILDGNNDISTHFYKKHRKSLVKYIKDRFEYMRDDDIYVIYGTSCSALYDQIYKENLRVEEQHLVMNNKGDWKKVTLYGYLVGIAYRQAINFCRKNSIPVKKKKSIDDSSEVEEKERKFVSTSYNDGFKDHSRVNSFDDDIDDYEQREEWDIPDEPGYDPEKERRWSCIHQAMSAITKQCNDILTLFYWDKLSMDAIANELGYSNAASAKVQKNKCMMKLKSYITTLLADN